MQRQRNKPQFGKSKNEGNVAILSFWKNKWRCRTTNRICLLREKPKMGKKPITDAAEKTEAIELKNYKNSHCLPDYFSFRKENLWQLVYYFKLVTILRYLHLLLCSHRSFSCALTNVFYGRRRHFCDSVLSVKRWTILTMTLSCYCQNPSVVVDYKRLSVVIVFNTLPGS